MGVESEPGEIERRIARAMRLRAEVARKERQVVRQVAPIAAALANLMKPGDHYYRRGIGLHAFDAAGSTCLAAAYLDEEGEDYRYRYAVLCGGDVARRALKMAPLDHGDSDEPGPDRRVAIAGIDDCEDFLYRLPMFLADVTKSWENRSSELDEAHARARTGRRMVAKAEHRRPKAPGPAPKEGESVAYTNEDLFHALGRYEQQCVAAGMTPKAVHSYWDYARRFLDWRTGEYQPRGSTSGSRTALVGSVSTADLANDARAYARDIEAAGRSQPTIDTYYRHAMFFIRWLDGTFEPGARLTGHS